MMFDTCANCMICEGIQEQTKPRKLCIGNIDSKILFIDGVAKDNDILESIFIKLFPERHNDILYTNSVRCVSDFIVTDEFLFSCSIYTFYLLKNKKYLFVTKLASEQLGIDIEFEIGKMFHCNLGFVMFVDNLIDIEYNNLYEFYIPKIDRFFGEK